jgi:hypothetical protein
MPLNDFSDQVDRLGYNYLFARMKYLYSRSCKRGRPKEGNIFIEPSGIKNWPKLDLLNACRVLSHRIHEMARANGTPKTWMQLYQGNRYDIDPDVDFLERKYRFPWNKEPHR